MLCHSQALVLIPRYSKGSYLVSSNFFAQVQGTRVGDFELNVACVLIFSQDHEQVIKRGTHLGVVTLRCPLKAQQELKHTVKAPYK